MEGYAILFTSAFLAATILPFYSEVVLIGLVASGYDPLGLWFWATLGNTLGAGVNWVIGRYMLHFQDRRWFPVRPDALARGQRWFQRYGVWSLLLTWAPVGGDALTFLAGIMRVRFDLFFVLCAIGKGARYAVLIWLTDTVGASLPAQ